jgi:hypothetical protein
MRQRTTIDLPSSSSFVASPSSQLSFSGSFGAQYAPIKRFNIFGETGYAYTRVNTSASAGSVNAGTPTSTGFRSAVGVLLYFDP